MARDSRPGPPLDVSFQTGTRADQLLMQYTYAIMDWNLRRGYLAEQLGAYLLRPLAAVADVPRPDDVGIDAIATLLRFEDVRQMVPEASFYVQFKAASIKKVKYTRDQFDWLLQLRLPFFFGRVQVSDASIELYSGHILSRSRHAVPLSSYAEFEFSFENELTFGDYMVDGRKLLRLRTGPPILRWSSNDICCPKFLKNAYDILRKTISIEELNFAIRDTEAVILMDWTANHLPRRTGSMSKGSCRGGADLTRALETAKGPYENVLGHCVHSEMDDRDIELHRRMIDYFRRHGVNVDGREVFEWQAGEWLARVRKRRAAGSETESDTTAREAKH